MLHRHRQGRGSGGFGERLHGTLQPLPRGAFQMRPAAGQREFALRVIQQRFDQVRTKFPRCATKASAWSRTQSRPRSA